MSRYLRQSTAFTFRIGPFVDSTDGVTAETALSIAQADIQISKDGAAFAQTSGASPTTTHDTDGWYQCPLTATDTDTLGPLTVQIVMAGAAPVWEHFMVVPANVYDALVDGSDNLQVDLTQIGGVAQSATDLKDFADAGYDPATNKVEGVKTVDTTTTNSDMRGTDSALLASSAPTNFSALSITAGGLVNITQAAADKVWSSTTRTLSSFGTLVQDIWDKATSALTTAGSIGKLLVDNVNATVSSRASQSSVDTVDANVDAILVDTAEIGVAGAGLTEAGGTGDHLTAQPWNAAWDAEVQSEAADALTAYDPPTKAELDVLGTAALATEAKQDIIDGNVDLVLVDTNELQTDWADGGRLDLLLDRLITEVDTARGEPGQGAPPVSTKMADKIDYLYKFLRNKSDQTSTLHQVYDDAGTTVDHKRTISDDGTTFAAEEVASGP